MKYEIIVCDNCNPNSGIDDGTRVNSYVIYPKIGEEGYLIDQENMDLCQTCLKEFKEKNPNKDVYILTSNVHPTVSGLIKIT